MVRSRKEYFKKYCRQNKERISQYGKQWYQQNKEHRSKVGKKWYEENREQRLAQMREYHANPTVRLHYRERTKKYQSIPEVRARRNAYMREWTAKHRDHARTKWKTYYQLHKNKLNLERRNEREELRQKLFDLLGQKCLRCGFVDKRALQFDHIQSDGYADIKRVGKGEQLYRFYIKHPEEANQKLQVLCANCNWIKKHMRGENAKSSL